MAKLYVLESCSECPEIMKVGDTYHCPKLWDGDEKYPREIPIDIIIEEDRFPDWCPLENTKLKGE